MLALAAQVNCELATAGVLSWWNPVPQGSVRTKPLGRPRLHCAWCPYNRGTFPGSVGAQLSSQHCGRLRQEDQQFESSLGDLVT